MSAAHMVLRYYYSETGSFGEDISRLAGLAAWRLGKGVYRFDPDYAAAIDEAVIDDDIPGSMLLRLPEWGVYVVCPVDSPIGEVKGFFAHLENDAGNDRSELRILWDLDTETGPLLVGFPIYLDRPLTQGIAAVLENAYGAAQGIENPDADGDPSQFDQSTLDSYVELAKIAIARLLVLVVTEPDVDNIDAPDQAPEPTQPGKRGRWFAAQKPTTWDVGYRVGTALRQSQLDRTQLESDPTKQKNSPRPHVRKGHFHLYWTGPGRQEPKLRFVRPTLIGTGNLPITEVPVKPSP